MPSFSKRVVSNQSYNVSLSAAIKGASDNEDPYGVCSVFDFEKAKGKAGIHLYIFFKRTVHPRDFENERLPSQ